MINKNLGLVAFFILLISCTTEESPKAQLSNPGFGVIETSISRDVNTTNLPVLIKTDQVIKGLQFTLTWDGTAAKIGQPQLTGLNSKFTVSVGKASAGQMKVLVFSMTGEALDTSEPVFMTIPVSILDSETEEISIFFNKAVFAGPNASSYDIPVTHAQLKVKNS